VTKRRALWESSLDFLAYLPFTLLAAICIAVWTVFQLAQKKYAERVGGGQ
jgi:hypothetical protein